MKLGFGGGEWETGCWCRETWEQYFGIYPKCLTSLNFPKWMQDAEHATRNSFERPAKTLLFFGKVLYHVWWQQHHRAPLAVCNPRWACMLMTGKSSRDLNGTQVSLRGGIWCCPMELRSTPFIYFPAMNFYHFCCYNLHYYVPGRSWTAWFCCWLYLLFLLMERMGN